MGWFIAGLFIGAFVAVVIMALCIANKASEMSAQYLKDSSDEDR